MGGLFSKGDNNKSPEVPIVVDNAQESGVSNGHSEQVWFGGESYLRFPL